MESKKVKLTLTKVSRKNGTGKNGKPYQSIGFQCKEKPDVWVNGWGNEVTDLWAEGDEVEVKIFTQDYNGTEQFRFELESSAEKTTDLEARVAKLEQAVFKNGESTVIDVEADMKADIDRRGDKIINKNNNIDPESIPF